VTWLVIGAKLKVLITEKSTPTFFADALPLLRAGSMNASWIQFTFVTSWSLVSALASVFFFVKGEDERKTRRDN
jgi:uncharacterized protein (DUF1810 family)